MFGIPERIILQRNFILQTFRQKTTRNLIEKNSILLFLAKKGNLPIITANFCFFIVPKLPLTGPKLPLTTSILTLTLMAIWILLMAIWMLLMAI